MKRYDRTQTGIGLIVAVLFVLFQLVTRKYQVSSEFQSIKYQQTRISQIRNNDASLSAPFLDKVNEHWFVGGQPKIRNTEHIRLTSYGGVKSHGVLISNGVGDNTINDFEVTLKFKISGADMHRHQASEGLVLLLTPDNTFIKEDLHSSYARKQYHLNSGGVSVSDTDLMGFPKNLPGLAVVIDTLNNNAYSMGKVPFLDIFFNTDPLVHAYDKNSDGEKSTSQKLNKKHIKLKKSIIQGQEIELRLIYVESVNFLKLDIKYADEGNFWIELFQSQEPLFIPKNPKTHQRYLGVGSLAQNTAANVDILGIKTDEFHWDDGNEDDESLDFMNHLRMYLKQSYGKDIKLAKDDFLRWKMKRAQPSYNFSQETDFFNQKQSWIGWLFNLILKSTIFLVILLILYFISLYMRVSLKHIKLRDKKRYKQSILPQ